jgi:hypothetical protein
MISNAETKTEEKIKPVVLLIMFLLLPEGP